MKINWHGFLVMITYKNLDENSSELNNIYDQNRIKWCHKFVLRHQKQIRIILKKVEAEKDCKNEGNINKNKHSKLSFRE